MSDDEDRLGRIMADAFLDERRKMELDMAAKTPRIASPVAQAEMRSLLGKVYPNRNLTQQEQALEKMAELQHEIDLLRASNQALVDENQRLRDQLQRERAQQTRTRSPMPPAQPITPPAVRPTPVQQAAAPVQQPERAPDEEDPSSARFRLLELD